MKKINNQANNPLFSQPTSKPAQKGWSPFKKLNILRLKYGPSKSKKEKGANAKNGESNVAPTRPPRSDGDDIREVLDICREAVEEYNRTSRTRDPRQRLSRTISCQSINKRVLANSLGLRTKQFNASTPDLLNLRQANIPDTVDEVDSIDEEDVLSGDGADHLKDDRFLAEIMDKFPKPPQLDMDRTIRARRQRETPRVRTGSVASFSTTTTNGSTTLSNCSNSTAPTSYQSHSRQTSTASTASSQVPSQRLRKISTETTYSLRTPTISKPFQPIPSNNAPFPASSGSQLTPRPSPTHHRQRQYSDATPPPVPPKDRPVRRPSNATEKLPWCPGEGGDIITAFPLEIARMGREILGGSADMNFNMQELEAEVNKLCNEIDAKPLQRRASEKVKSGPGEGAKLNRKPRVPFKQPVDAGAYVASKMGMLPPMTDA
jgi:hypothetical protein